MKWLVFMVMLFSSDQLLKAQKVYYIYFESENKQAFYVKMADNVFTSNTTGYLTVSNLTDSTYQVSVGFPNSTFIGRFNITINSKDRGFLIKILDNQVVLFDLVTLSIIKPIPDPTKSHTSLNKRNDEFTTLLSRAANDTSLLYVQVADKQEAIDKKQEVVEKKETPIKKEEKPIVNTNPPKVDLPKDTTAITFNEPKKTTENKNIKESLKKDSTTNAVSVKDKLLPKDTVSIKKDTSEAIVKKPIETIPDLKTKQQVIDSSTNKEAIVYTRSKIVKHSESSTSEGFGLTFFDNYSDGSDTIKLIIPNPKYQLKLTDDPQDTKGFLDVQPRSSDSETKKEVKNNRVSDTAISVKKTDQAILKRVRPACEHRADNNDFLKLRRYMAAKENDEAMISEAKKYFRNRCFTTEQIRNLSSLFLTAAGKYEFFDTAFQHVSDQELFGGLQTEIKDDYYSRRFKALIGE
jgi:hypothetical protein